MPGTEQNTEQSIQETGGIPQIEVSLQVSGMTQTAVDKTLSISDMAADAKATGDALANILADIQDIDASIGGIEEWTGEDIPVNSTQGAMTIAEAFSSIMNFTYPVGSIYTTINNSLPTVLSSAGTWVEVKMPLTWNDIKNGTRGYVAVSSGDTTGPVHYWLRTA